MKKVTYMLIALTLVITTFAFPLSTGNVQAKTLRQLKQELANKEAEYNSNKKKQQMTQAEITASKNRIAEINKDGSIIIEGSFNDGRRTDSFYKFR